MDRNYVLELLKAVQRRDTSVEDALVQLRYQPYSDLGFAKLDHHRSLRQGFPEVVLCQGKTEAQVVAIMEQLASRHQVVLGTRATPEVSEAVQRRIPSAVYHATARAITIGNPIPIEGSVLVLSAGTGDLPVAEEACVTASVMGAEVQRLYDVGVAGLHRLLDRLERLSTADALVVVAGMDGALPSVVGGLADRPVIAVPTSIGYGACLGGLAPLLSMLNSCAAGVTVVNIDNGFGGGFAAAVIARQIARARTGRSVERSAAHG